MRRDSGESLSTLNPKDGLGFQDLGLRVYEGLITNPPRCYHATISVPGLDRLVQVMTEIAAGNPAPETPAPKKRRPTMTRTLEVGAQEVEDRTLWSLPQLFDPQRAADLAETMPWDP